MFYLSIYLKISCAARDALSWLVLRTHPYQMVPWSTVDVTKFSGKPSSTTVVKRDEASTGVPNTADSSTAKDRTEVVVREVGGSDSQVDQSGATQLGGRRRPNRHVIISGNRLVRDLLSIRIIGIVISTVLYICVLFHFPRFLNVNARTRDEKCMDKSMPIYWFLL